MSDKTSIEWATSTWNPIRGQNARHTCARISPGCDHCYAATMTRRGLMGTAPIDYGVGETPNDPARLDEKALLQPLRWKQPRTIFVASMTDLFGTWVPDEWLDRIFDVMNQCPQHTFQVLTKRPTRMRDYLTAFYSRIIETSKANHAADLLDIPDSFIDAKGFDIIARRMFWHVWFGTTIESDQFAWRADRLRQTPAAVRWVSAEPLLSELPSLDLTGIDWLVAGGESGPGARPSHPDWYRDLRDRCAASDTAYFFKQWGAYVPTGYDRDRDDPEWRQCTEAVEATPRGQWLNLSGGQGFHGERLIRVERVGKHRSGRLLDGREHNAYPGVLA